MNEVEQEADQGDAGKDIESVSMNSIQFNKNCSVLAAHLKTSAGQNNIMVPHKIDTGSDSNIMPLHVYKNYFPA